MAKRLARLSKDETDLLVAGKSNPDLLSNYFIKKPGAKQGWILDDNFAPEGAWQRDLHFAKQKRIVIIGGFGSGKTRCVGVSGTFWCITTHDFAFMNCAPTQYQALLMYNFILEIAEDTRLGDMIYAAPRSPYPQIIFKFYAGDILMTSKMEFMSIDRNAVQILSWEGDWVNIDEAGRIDTLAETLTHLGSRLRGSVNGRPRLGRLSITSNSWDNPELWSRYDRSLDEPENYLSKTVSSRHNHNITEEQLHLMLQDIPEDEHERYIDGTRPEGKGNYFSKQKVYACEVKGVGDLVKSAAESGIDGYKYQEMRGNGAIQMEVPRLQQCQYVITGDPGTGNVPLRNSPAIMVWNVTDFPAKPTMLDAYWWGFGNGSTIPFIRNILRLMIKYNPIMTAIDSTGTQAHTAEVLNTYLYSARETGKLKIDWLGEELDMSAVMVPHFEGMDFSGGKKPAYLVSARLFIEAELAKWPAEFTGLRRQLTNYDPEQDKTNGYLAQDLVATFAMFAYATRILFNISAEDLAKISIRDTDKKSGVLPSGILRSSKAGRTQRARTVKKQDTEHTLFQTLKK